MAEENSTADFNMEAGIQNLATSMADQNTETTNPNSGLNPETLNPNSEQSPKLEPTPNHNSEEQHGVKRKNDGKENSDSFWKTSLCSYFRRHARDCRHGENCRYAHSEQELRPRPDNSWDPTSERAKRLKREKELDLNPSEDPEGLSGVTDSRTASLSKCIINIPKGWFAGRFKRLLDDLELPYSNAKKKKGASVGFVTFSSEEYVMLATEKLNGHTINKQQLKVADVLPRSWEKQKAKQVIEEERNHQHVDDSDASNSQTLETEELGDGNTIDNQNMVTDGSIVKTRSVCDELGDGNTIDNQNMVTDGSIIKTRSARDAVTPLADMPYEEQLNQKKNSVMQILKKLARNARKACPSELALPEWILSAKERGGLACQFEGILNSPVVNGYRNKCEFTVGHSTDGEIAVGFLLGNFREGLTAVEEPTKCPNVSTTACKFASIFQNFVLSSPLPVWNKYQNRGFWRLFTVRDGRAPIQVSNSENEQPNIAEVMLIVQICSAGVEEKLKSSEFKRMAQELTVAAATASPPLPLTALFVQDHLGISNAAPADAPLFPIHLPKVVAGKIVEGDCREPVGQIHDYINSLCFRISPTAFFQVNSLAAERLYSLAGDWAQLSPTTLLFDVCCGTGTIGLTLASRAGMVVGIEMIAPAVADAQRNAEINGIKNCRFVCAKAEDVMESLLKEYLDITTQTESDIKADISEKSNDNMTKECSSQSEEQRSDSSVPKNVEDNNVDKECEELDNKGTSSLGISSQTNGDSEIKKDDSAPKQFNDVVAIVDPPRAGLHPTVIKALRTHPCLRRLVYISCNPETLLENAIELCTPSTEKNEKGKGNTRGFRHMSNLGHARQRAKSMPMSEAFRPVKAMAVDLFPHTPHCEVVMLLER
ncbi:hypothetical protein SUGI_1125730 [Cryptomeria japonica]|uniref:zinc finger CCCH domain-containing protein 24 n=1 Tax=Cryptomeria japonica TaxID=3369 RepID=UPI002414B9BE|nr:zinc finger CCCH domain-containing protein 24 [Cryptomeria japonica]GLJ52845.1 hypothetical protein SUGI_1125730 [Cryptomeria japonica]